MFGSFINTLMAGFGLPECFDKMAPVTVALAIGLAFNALLGTVLCLYTAYLFKSQARMDYWRIYLGRCLILTQTSSNKFIFVLAYTMDAISCILLVAEIAFIPSARKVCNSGFMTFYELAIILQSFVVLRMFLFCVHFTRLAKPFYKWLKRQSHCLRTVESEQRLVLDVWKLEHYVRILKS